MNNLRIKWSNLTGEQRKQAKSYHEEREKNGEKMPILNQLSYFVNPKDGNLVFTKDF